MRATLEFIPFATVGNIPTTAEYNWEGGEIRTRVTSKT